VKIRNAILAGALVLGTPAAGVVAATVPAQAATVTCTHIHSDRWSTTSTGSRSHTIVNENKCGRSYEKWTYRWFQSYTGAHSITHTYKDEDYPHFQQRAVRDSWTKTGSYSRTITVTSG
jgi:hypothetical protein